MMSESQKCLKCGGTDLKPGQLCGAFQPGLAFRPEGGGLASYKKHAINVQASICLDCGFVAISGDPDAAKALIKKVEGE